MYERVDVQAGVKGGSDGIHSISCGRGAGIDVLDELMEAGVDGVIEFFRRVSVDRFENS
jgi:hypothetical protein